jgi:hypothetical protein
MSFSISPLGFSFIVFTAPRSTVTLLRKKVILKTFHNQVRDNVKHKIGHINKKSTYSKMSRSTFSLQTANLQTLDATQKTCNYKRTCEPTSRTKI